MSLDEKVGTQVTIEGTARNAKAGAIVVMSDRTPVYVQGLARWDRTFDGKAISASGTLVKRGGEHVGGDSGAPSTGIPGAHFVLEQPTWTLS